MINDIHLSTVKPCYLGSHILCNGFLDEVSLCLARFGAAFGKLTCCLWNAHGTHVDTKEYKAVALTSLLYGCKVWTLYRRHIRKFDKFHLRCLRKKILQICGQDRVTNTSNLEQCKMSAIEAMVNQTVTRSHK